MLSALMGVRKRYALLLVCLCFTFLLHPACGEDPISNDAENENAAADAGALKRALTACATMVGTSVVALLVWWVVGSYYLDRDAFWRSRMQIENDVHLVRRANAFNDSRDDTCDEDCNDM